MRQRQEHYYIGELKQQLADKKVNRREFLRTATLLGMSVASAYSFVGQAAETSAHVVRAPARLGGTIRIGMNVHDVGAPHRFSTTAASNVARQVNEYLTKTGVDNVTRPYLAESWDVSDDLKTWTLHLRKDVTWHTGRRFTADDVVWNIKHVLDEKSGSSVQGLMKGYMLEEHQRDGTTHTRLWDANAVEKIDAHTVRLNCKVPQLAVPEHLFHYPLLMLDPEQGSDFGPGANGTGAFELVEHEVGKRSMLKARYDYWSTGPYVDTIEYIDLGDDAATAIDAVANRRVHGLMEADIIQLEAFKLMPHLRIYDAATAQTGVARGKVTQKPFDDARVRKALRLAIDTQTTHELVFRNALGSPAEHHHVCPIHPEYAELPVMRRDVTAAKALLAEAGYPEGVDLGKIDCIAAPAWELNAVRALVEQWKDIGVRVQINVVPEAHYWSIWNKSPFSFTGWAHRPLGIMALGLAYRSGVPWNESEYSNPEFDALLTEAEGLLDVDQRREVIRKIERIMQEDGPVVQPSWRALATVMDKRVTGFRMHPTRYIFANELGLHPH